MNYKFKVGYFPVKAGDCGKYFEEIQDKFGEINPEYLVDKAKDESNLLHECFEWNDTIAAGKYRVIQAKDLIRTLVKVDKIGDEEKETRAVVSVAFSEGEQRKYYMSTVVMQNECARKNLLRDAYNDCRIFAEKYSTLTELESVLKAINSLEINT